MRLYTLLSLTVALFAPAADLASAGSDWKQVFGESSRLMAGGRNAEAGRLLEGRIETARKEGEDSADLASALNDLGSIYYDGGRFLDAERILKESLLRWRRVAPSNPKFAIALANLGSLRLTQGKLIEARRLHEEALAVLAAANRAGGREAAGITCGLADVLLEIGLYEDARVVAEGALSILRRVGPETPELGFALFLLAKIAFKQQREAEAEQLIRSALEAWRASPGPESPTYASGLMCLAVIESGRNPDHATRLFEEALALVGKNAGSDHFLAGEVLMLYSEHLKKTRNKREARQLRRRGEAILAGHARENGLGQTIDFGAFQRENVKKQKGQRPGRLGY